MNYTWNSAELYQRSKNLLALPFPKEHHKKSLRNLERKMNI